MNKWIASLENIRLLVFFLGIVILFFSGVEHFSQQIDDLYISLTYAREVYTNGSLQWSSGERVEGYSNFLWVLALIPAVAFGIGPGVYAKGLSLVSGVVLLWSVHRRYPWWVLFLLASNASFAYWSWMGMETITQSLLLFWGWGSLASRRHAHGLWILAVLSLLRIDGMAHVVLATVLLVVFRPDSLRDIRLILPFLVVGGYHYWRWVYFGSLWSGPLLVKVVGVRTVGSGLTQWGEDILPMVVLLGLATYARPVRGWGCLCWSLAPLLLQGAILSRADGDWMGWARMTLPGVVGCLGVVGSLGASNSLARPYLYRGFFLLGLGLGLVLPPTWGRVSAIHFRSLHGFLHPVSCMRTPMETPVLLATEWMIERVPLGGIVQTRDVGIPGLVEGMVIRDPVGLVDRAVAEWIAWREEAAWAELQRRYREDLTCVHLLDTHALTPPDTSAWLPASYTHAERQYLDGRRWSWWFCQNWTPVSPEVVTSRWLSLAAQVPDQPWVRWRAALHVADHGDLAHARELMSGLRFIQAPYIQEFPASVSFVPSGLPAEYREGKGFPLYTAGEIWSRLFTHAEADTWLELSVESPGESGARVQVGWSPGCEMPLQEVTIHETTLLTLPAASCMTYPGRLSVRFLNDAVLAEEDRNVFVRLVTAPVRPR